MTSPFLIDDQRILLLWTHWRSSLKPGRLPRREDIDPIAVNDIRDLIKHLKDRGIGVLITDHNVRETLDIVDRAYILHDGRVLMEGRPNEIVAHEDVRRVYLGERFSL